MEAKTITKTAEEVDFEARLMAQVRQAEPKAQKRVFLEATDVKTAGRFIAGVAQAREESAEKIAPIKEAIARKCAKQAQAVAATQARLKEEREALREVADKQASAECARVKEEREALGARVLNMAREEWALPKVGAMVEVKTTAGAILAQTLRRQ